MPVGVEAGTGDHRDDHGHAQLPFSYQKRSGLSMPRMERGRVTQSVQQGSRVQAVQLKAMHWETWETVHALPLFSGS